MKILVYPNGKLRKKITEVQEQKKLLRTRYVINNNENSGCEPVPYDENPCIGTTEFGNFAVAIEADVKKVKKYKNGTLKRDKENKTWLINRLWLWLVPGMLLLTAVSLSFFIPQFFAMADDDVPGLGREVIQGEGNVIPGGVNWDRDAADGSGTKLAFSVNVHPVVDKETQTGNFLIVNPDVNEMAMIAEIYLDGKEDEENLLYRSPLIPPFSHVEDAVLSNHLEPGTYNAVCYLHGVTNEDNPQHIGKVGVEIKITVQ